MNINIGKLYQFKKLYQGKGLYWFLYPSKEIAAAANAGATTTDAGAARVAASYSKKYNCNVSYVFPNSIFCLLEKDGIYYKAITANGELGWFYLSDKHENIIEEVNQ
jgi:mevalonate pyrophosphate decarboxylase